MKINNYIGDKEIKTLFKDMPFICQIKNISINGQRRGCSGFITNLETGKICYITTELFFNGAKGSGLWNDSNKAIMMRTAKNLHDYTGGLNHWIPKEKIVETAKRLTV